MLRQGYFSDEMLAWGPFNLDAIQFDGGTITGSEQELHELGQCLVEAVGSRSWASKGKWDVTVVPSFDEFHKPPDQYQPGDVCIAHDDRFEWVLEWQDAWLLMEDYAQMHIEKLEDKDDQTRLNGLYEQAIAANRIEMDDKALIHIKDKAAHDFLQICDSETLHPRRSHIIGLVMREQWLLFMDLYDDIAVEVCAWLEGHKVTSGGWCDHFTEIVLDQSVSEAKKNRSFFIKRQAEIKA